MVLSHRAVLTVILGKEVNVPKNPVISIVDDLSDARNVSAQASQLLVEAAPIPTILMIAFPNDRDLARALQSRLVGYLTKPGQLGTPYSHHD